MAKIQVDESFNGKTIQVSVGDIIEMQLNETPTTGYRWEFSQLNKNELELENEEFKIHQGTGIGGGGMKTFILKVVSKSNGYIKLENRQKWSGNVYEIFQLFYHQ